MMIDMWAATENEYAVLTTYVADRETLGRNLNKARGPCGRLRLSLSLGDEKLRRSSHAPPPLSLSLASTHAQRRGRSRTCATRSGAGAAACATSSRAARNLARPKLSTLWAAGVAFSKCHAEREVPYDPYTPHVFDGEEFSRGARLWTAGYDFYTPSRTVIAHDYKKSQRDAKHSAWDHGSAAERKKSHARLATLLELPNADRSPAAVAALGAYGLGARRTLAEYMDFTGIDLRHAPSSRTAAATSRGARSTRPSPPSPPPPPPPPAAGGAAAPPPPPPAATTPPAPPRTAAAAAAAVATAALQTAALAPAPARPPRSVPAQRRAARRRTRTRAPRRSCSCSSVARRERRDR